MRYVKNLSCCYAFQKVIRRVLRHICCLRNSTRAHFYIESSTEFSIKVVFKIMFQNVPRDFQTV